MNKLRSFLCTLAKILGDINAIKKGKIERRVARRIAGKGTSRMLSKIFRRW